MLRADKLLMVNQVTNIIWNTLS